jgi:Hypoxia induced protein conserved region
MHGFVNLLVPVAIAVVFVILLAGLWNMMRGGSPNRSQKLMRARILAQFAAIVVAMTALWLMRR